MYISNLIARLLNIRLKPYVVFFNLYKLNLYKLNLYKHNLYKLNLYKLNLLKIFLE